MTVFSVVNIRLVLLWPYILKFYSNMAINGILSYRLHKTEWVAVAITAHNMTAIEQE